MLVQRRRLLLVLALLASSLFSLAVAAHAWKKDKKIAAAAQMDAHTQALHALQRLTFGPRPGDIERVTAMGLDKWIDQQLHPDRIDDSAVEARLAPFRTLHMDTKEMVENFPPGPVIRAVMEGKRPMPSDPVKRAIYQAQIERIREREERKQEKAGDNPTTIAPQAAAASQAATTAPTQNAQAAPVPSGDNPTLPATNTNETTAPAADHSPADDRKAQRREDKLYADLKAEELLDKPPDERMKEVLQMSPEEQLTLSGSLRSLKGDQFLEGMNPKQKEAMLALNSPEQVVGDELMQAKLLRAIYSERQLEEVMTDFWFNHFNVFIGKGADRYMVTSYEREVIRPHALGKFEDLLVATAKSPGMLFYLDNWLSVGPDSDIARGIRRYRNRPYRRRFPPPPNQAKGKKRNGGLNENYGRELMELHTLGVNGGYTQQDVTEVAKVLTGWTIDQPQKGGGFKYEERMHEPGTKILLGHKIKDRGEKEGMEVLHILAHHPSTAHFISTKLAMRFVSDDPPPALVDRMAQTFLKKNGDIREVLTTMLKSPEFWSESAYRAKVKTPLEFVVSSVRTTAADVTDALPLTRQLNQLGMPLYGMQPPTGYSMKEEAWVNSSALLGRLNFSVALMSGKIRGVQVDANRLVPAHPSTPGAQPDSAQILAVLENSLLAGTVSKQTHDAIVSELQNQATGQSIPKAVVKPAARKNDKPAPPPPASNAGTIAGLILGSPEFQRR